MQVWKEDEQEIKALFPTSLTSCFGNQKTFTAILKEIFLASPSPCCNVFHLTCCAGEGDGPAWVNSQPVFPVLPASLEVTKCTLDIAEINPNSHTKPEEISHMQMGIIRYRTD